MMHDSFQLDILPAISSSCLWCL